MNGPTGNTKQHDSEADISAATHMFMGVCVALVLAFLVWSYFGRLDIVSTAVGEVIPSSQVKSIQHLEGGIVREILAHEGDLVEKGQPLVVLESTQSGSDLKELNVRITSQQIDIARLKAEMSGSEKVDFPKGLIRDHPNLVAQSADMFKTRRRKLKGDMAAQREQIIQRTQDMKTISERIKNARKSLKLVDEQIAISRELLKDDLTNRMVHLNLLKEAADLNARIDEAAAAKPSAAAALKEAQIKLKGVTNDYRENVSKELNLKRRSLEEFSNRIRKFEDSLKRTVLRSPVKGVVKTMRVFTVGGVVKPGATVVDVVPGGDRLVIEARLATGDIGYVHSGQSAMVALASADAGRFSPLKGTVTQVSPDTIRDDKGVPFYKVRITTKRSYFERKGLRYRLVPGVQVISSIRTGQRSILEYILDPYFSSLQTALRER